MNEMYRDYLIIAFGRFDELTGQWQAVADISRTPSFNTLIGFTGYKAREEAERAAHKLATDWIDNRLK
jgi:hypothetical protein